MKNFTKKIFMLSAAMLLSVGAFADDVTHRFPEIPFSTGDPVRHYVMPAWDAKLTADGDLRMQVLSYDADAKTATVKIVARRVFSTESDNYGSPLFASLTSNSNITIGGTTKTRDAWTYGDAADALGITIATEARSTYVFRITAVTSGTDFAIRSSYTVAGSSVWTGYTFNIVEIGEGAFRNYDTSEGQWNICAVTGTLTIPNTITSIGHNAFRHCVFKKVVFEAGSTIQTIEKATFEGCVYMEEINIPASVTTIEGTAFGGCQALNKMVFEGNLPTLTKVDEEPGYTGHGTYKGPYDIFTAAQRFAYYNKNVTPSKCIIEVPLGTAKSYIDFDQNSGEENAEPYYLFAQFPMSSPFPLTTTSGLMTYCSELDYTFKKYDTSSQTWGDADMKAYYVKGDEVEVGKGKVTLTAVPDDAMIAGWDEDNDFGVVLKGTPNETYEIFYPNGVGTGINQTLSMEDIDNCLKGCVTPTDVAAGSDEHYSYFIMSGGVFKRITKDGQCKANRAYIKIAGGPDTGGPETESKDLVLSFPGESTGITAHEVQSAQDDAWYTLQGIQVQQPSKGVFIKNGKKFVIK